MINSVKDVTLKSISETASVILKDWVKGETKSCVRFTYADGVNNDYPIVVELSKNGEYVSVKVECLITEYILSSNIKLIPDYVELVDYLIRINRKLNGSMINDMEEELSDTLNEYFRNILGQ